jgi:hypothetical protein
LVTLSLVFVGCQKAQESAGPTTPAVPKEVWIGDPVNTAAKLSQSPVSKPAGEPAPQPDATADSSGGLSVKMGPQHLATETAPGNANPQPSGMPPATPTPPSVVPPSPAKPAVAAPPVAAVSPARLSDSALVTPEMVLAIVLRPNRMKASPAVAEVLNDDLLKMLGQQLGFDFALLEEVTYLIPTQIVLRDNQGEPPSLIFRFSKPVDYQAVSGEVLKRFLAVPNEATIDQQMVAGRTAYCPKSDGSKVAFLAGDRVLVATTLGTMMKMIDRDAPPSPLADRLRRQGSEQDLIVAAAPGSMRESIRNTLAQNPQTKSLGLPEAVENLAALTVSIDLANDTFARAVLEANQPQGLAVVESAVGKTLELARTLTAPPGDSAPADPRMELARQVLATVQVSRAGTQVVLTAKKPEHFDELMTKAVGAALGPKK